MVFLMITILIGVSGFTSLLLWLAFLWQLMILHIFSCTCGSSICPPCKMSLQIICPFLKFDCLFLLLSCMSSLHILDISPLLDMWFANIFFHSIGCLFIFSTLCFFAVQKVFSLTDYHLFICALVVYALGIISPKSLPISLSRSFPLCFLL